MASADVLYETFEIYLNKAKAAEQAKDYVFQHVQARAHIISILHCWMRSF